jgi:hypothetical protein
MSTGERKNQRQRILDLLIAAHGQEVPSVALSHISLQYGARVKELRSLGFRIPNRTERHAGKVYGYFHLEADLPTKAQDAKPITLDSPSNQPADVLADTTASLFGDLAPDRSYAE